MESQKELTVSGVTDLHSRLNSTSSPFGGFLPSVCKPRQSHLNLVASINPTQVVVLGAPSVGLKRSRSTYVGTEHRKPRKTSPSPFRFSTGASVSVGLNRDPFGLGRQRGPKLVSERKGAGADKTTPPTGTQSHLRPFQILRR